MINIIIDIGNECVQSSALEINCLLQPQFVKYTLSQTNICHNRNKCRGKSGNIDPHKIVQNTALECKLPLKQ